MSGEWFGPYLTRSEAQRLGAAWYVGKPCKAAAHLPYRYAGAGCIECARANARAAAARRPRKPRALLTPEERAERRRRSSRAYDSTPARKASHNARQQTEETKARKAAWEEANRDHRNKLRRMAHALDPNPKRMRRRRRRARQAGAEGYCTADQAATLLQLQGGRCAYCGAADDLHLDHRVPLSRGGSNWPINLQWLCAWHNVSKGAATDEEYRDRMGIARLTPWDVAAGLYLFAD